MLPRLLPQLFRVFLVASFTLTLPLFAQSDAASHGADPALRAQALRTQIAHHDALYFQKDAPEISDHAYDLLKQELRALEADHPEWARDAGKPTGTLGDDRTGRFPLYQHRARVLGLEKAYSEREARSFHSRLAKHFGHEELDFVVEPKVDGLSVSATYEHGELVRAVTRGNGQFGEDITVNAHRIKNLPTSLRTKDAQGNKLDLPDVIEIRGEIYLPLAEFQRLNHEREIAGEPPFANPRNLAAGTIRQINADQIIERGLAVIFYGFAACSPESSAPTTQLQLHERLEQWGLPHFEKTWPATGANEMWDAIREVGGARSNLPFPTDGAVVKLDSVALQHELGESETAPRWAVAYKFSPPQMETKLRSITLQVGRTGVLTPVAELDPVVIAGSRISRATLHNRDEITRLDLQIGDYVILEKAGEIIPAIVGVNRQRRPQDSVTFTFPTICPSCGTPLVNLPEESAVRCPNVDCSAQIKKRLEYFASKSCVGIDGLGPAIVARWVENYHLKNPADLYRLKISDLAAPGKAAGKSSEKILTAIESSKRAELWRFIRGIGIPDVGEAAAKELAQHFGDLNRLAQAEGKDLTWLSPSLSRATLTFLTEPTNREMLLALVAAGVNPKMEATVMPIAKN